MFNDSKKKAEIKKYKMLKAYCRIIKMKANNQVGNKTHFLQLSTNLLKKG